MADKERTPPAAASSPPASSALGRVGTTSPPKAAADRPASPEQTSLLTAPHADALTTADEAVANNTEMLPEDDHVEADFDNVSDSGFGTDNSDSTSIASSMYAGYVENGRRYQTKREGEYWGPSDEKQFESMQAAHLLCVILDSQQPNPLFRSPIPETAQNILDVGTGNGAWAVEVADRYSSAFVRGVDLYPPPETWVPPNCKFEVDDVLKPWMFTEKFDLIHMRLLIGAFTPHQWKGIYRQAYENLLPGGWIEQVEPGIKTCCDDGTLPPDGAQATWHTVLGDAFTATGKPADEIDKMRSRIEAAGFTNLHEKLYKCPVGEWAKNPVLKEAGKFNKMQMKQGMEGYAMYILTKFGLPEPWSPEQVQVYLANVNKEMDTPGVHAYNHYRRVWAQKPYDTEPKVDQKVEVETLA